MINRLNFVNFVMEVVNLVTDPPVLIVSPVLMLLFLIIVRQLVSRVILLKISL